VSDYKGCFLHESVVGLERILDYAGVGLEGLTV